MLTFDTARQMARANGGQYLSAEVCQNGHLTTSGIELSPGVNAKFCPTCGAATIRACSKCEAPIRGDYYIAGMIDTSIHRPPAFCHNCGDAFPWTAVRIQAAKEHVAEIEELDQPEKEQLQAAIDDLTSEGPRTELAASRFKRLMKKAGPAVGASLQRIIVDVLSDAARKALM